MKILIAHDGSTYAELAVEDLRYAGLPENAEAIVVSVVESENHSSKEWMSRVSGALGCAEDVCNRLQTLFPNWTLWLETPSGLAAPTILDRANSWHANLIVVGTHGRTGLRRLVLGSVSQKVVTAAHCSVRVVRAGTGRKELPMRILIGNDGSPEGESAVNEVCRRSWPVGTEARVVSAVQAQVPVDVEGFAFGSHTLPASETFLESNAREHGRMHSIAEQSAQRLARAGLNVSFSVENNDPKEALIKEARNWNANTIVVGARGLGRVERFLLGSVSSALVTYAPCTVEVVRHL
jgi:nucleotide-binding universal stress UspA family protein